jgi:hypothetical protein
MLPQMVAVNSRKNQSKRNRIYSIFVDLPLSKLNLELVLGETAKRWLLFCDRVVSMLDGANCISP